MTPTKTLRHYFGYPSFRGNQQAIIEAVLAGRDVLVVQPTSFGKSLCYQIPALCLDGLTIVVSPLIALMADQVQALKAKGIQAEFANSTLTPGETLMIYDRCAAGKVKLLYCSPEKLASLKFVNTLCRNKIKISLIAFDEIHLADTWRDFRPAYQKFEKVRDLFPSIPIIALTATATKATRQIIKDSLRMKNPVEFIGSFDRPNLSFDIIPSDASVDKNEIIIEKIKNSNGSTIIYCLTRKECMQLRLTLRTEGIPALPYHAGLNTKDREDIQKAFMDNKCKVVCCTTAFGLGIDKGDVRLVIHYDVPQSIEGYFQECGRAGRDGKPSKCFLFYNPKVYNRHIWMINQSKDFLVKKDARERLDQMFQLCNTDKCIRQQVLEYFGEESGECSNCSSCLINQ